MTRAIWLVLVTATALCLGQKPADPPEPLDLRTPAAMMRLAARDVGRLNIGSGVGGAETVSIRYLDLSPVPPAERAHSFLVISGHLQHLSRSPLITRPRIVKGTAGSLLRLNLLDYGIKPQTWETLADTDPYYHQRVETLVDVPPYWHPGGVGSAGKNYAAGWYTKRRKTATALAPWLTPTEQHKRDLAYLVATTDSQAPILRADWFFYQTAAAKYYEFLGIKTVADFEKVIGFDRKLFEGFTVEVRASVAISGVTLQPRAIARRSSLGGGYWTTYDFKAFQPGQNPLEVLGGDIEKQAAASEGYGVLPNGFWATYAADGKGNLQQTVPPDIANDHVSPSNDKQIKPNLSCVCCHLDAGLRDIQDWHRNLIAPPLRLNVLTYDPVGKKNYNAADVIKLKQQYARSLEPLLKKDRLVFQEAVQEATGWEAKKYAQEYATFYERREMAKVDLSWAERDTGVPKEKILAALKRSLAVGKGDPVLSVLALEGERATGMPVQVWETKQADFWGLMTSYGTD